MRIESQTKIPGDRLQKNTVGTRSTASFANVMRKSQATLHMETLNQLMAAIDAEGQKLSKHKTLENLRDYKNSVKQFLGEAVHHGLQFSEKKSFTMHGDVKTHQLVEVVDQKLMELHDAVLQQEHEGIDTLSLIGEIKGLLVNMYM
ncbi:YaaR family protein [Planococcus salinus]|uniref:DUF327 family protein n=1 Tax=Planococcus salinus TaxID=1848460 RepID=A0A3M8P4X3_9BACL|nr:YaaR family protein [Planococcus salinus]RNF38738.1 DUF327 family protein [Planococcus salinus]